MSGPQNSRLANLVKKLQGLVNELSGYEVGDLHETVTFLELGFDSLFLTQLSTAFSREFGVKITFRQLFDEMPTLRAVGQFLDHELPVDQYKSAAHDLGAGSSEAVSSVEPVPAVNPADADWSRTASGPIRQMLDQQLQLMAEQLRVLQEIGTASRNVSMSPQAPAAAPAEKATGGPQLPKGFGPQTSSVRQAVTPEQQAHLIALTEAYTSRTIGSKERTQHYRARLADPRTAAGFNRLWKEMVYPIWIQRSSGCNLWDVDGNEYIDLLNGFGPNFLGHSPAFITEQIAKQVDAGVEIGPQTPRIGEVAEMICQLTGMDRVSFTCTGSEAVQAVMRIGRTVTSRDKVVCFKGDYHGNFDEVLVRGVNRKGCLKTMPMAPGIPMESVGNILVLDYGTDEALDIIAENADEIAVVMVEPVQSRRPDFRPHDFLHKLRKLTRDRGIVLHFDEVITGFRIRPGGAQEYFGVDADIATYGKVVGGGMPIGIVAGRAHLMDTFDGGMWQYGDDSFPEAGVTFFAGTFVRHPLAVAAAHATLRHLIEQGPDLQRRVNWRADRFANALNDLFRRNGIRISVPHFASQLFIRVEESELANLLFYHLRLRGIHLAEDFPSYMTAAHTDADIERILSAFTESVEAMQEGGIFPRPKGEEGLSPPSRCAGNYALTDGQREIWFASQLGKEASCAFNESDTVDLRGSLDVGKLRNAIQSVVERHEALHFRFSSDGETQSVASDLTLTVPLIDLTDRSSVGEREQAFADIVDHEATKAFDFEKGPMVRIQIVKLADDWHKLLVYGHHLVFDGWSSGVLFHEIGVVYSALTQGRHWHLPDATPYSEYIHLEHEASSGEAGRQSLAYWTDQYRTMPEPLELPTFRLRSRERSFAGGTIKWRLDDELHRAIKEVAGRHNTTLFALLLSGYQVLLSRLASTRDVVVGVSLAGQAMVDREALVGHGVKLLPLRADVTGSRTFADLLADTRARVFDLHDHHQSTLGRILQELPSPRDPSRPPLVQVQFNFSTDPRGLKFHGLKTSIGENPRRHVVYDLFANLLEENGSLTADWDYNAELFDEAAVRSWIGYFEHLLWEIASDSDRPVGQIALMPAAQREAQLVENNRTARDVPELCVHELISRQAENHPTKLAVTGTRLGGGPGELSYAELEQRSNQLARHLQGLGVGPDKLVAVSLDRHIDLMVALLGVLKAGGAYVPIDPGYPVERIQHMLDDSQAEWVITQAGLESRLCGSARHTVRMDTDWQAISQLDSGPVLSAARPEHLAYVIYTSGSTGKPKGVQIEHRALVNLLTSIQSEPGFTSDDVLLAVTTLSFDIAALELFTPLVVGARVHIVDQETAADGPALLSVMGAVEATVMQATPATWRLLIEAGWGDAELKVLCGGEALPLDLARQLAERSESVWNMYGPTETTIWSACQRIDPQESIVPIGRGIANTQLYILDDELQPVAHGVVGELYIAGEGLARGYLNLDELTRKRFLPNPFATEEGARMFRTGDRARMLDDGRIQCLERIDGQVKIRGFRIELGEIESALRRVPGVKEAAARVWRAGNDDVRLVGYVSNGGGEVDATAVRHHLASILPEYMLPQHVVTVEDMPRTPNGKLDRKQLPVPDAANITRSQECVVPRNDSERRIGELWREVLQIAQVGATDDFFELGGHSLLAARMLSRASAEFDVELGIGPFFSGPTVERLAERIDSQIYARGGGSQTDDQSKERIEI